MTIGAQQISHGGPAPASANNNNNNNTNNNNSSSNSSNNINKAAKSAPSTACMSSSSTAPNSATVFQQVKHTQASLARMSRVQQLNSSAQKQSPSGPGPSAGPSSELAPAAGDPATQMAGQQPPPLTKSTTFVDCLIRRFKDCFNEDSFVVPMFVVGNLSPGSDGTHLILPPCVSLEGQNINRFASPKNLRLMNSIRESCRSVEGLDLGANKLTDLIEIYKILQYTPNLKFLNLSENDLSRTPPVAVAATSCTTSSTTQANSFSSSNAPTHHGQNNWLPQQHLSSTHQSPYSSVAAQRSCLAPINQNHQPLGCARRHSALGQSMQHPPQLASNVTNCPQQSTSAQQRVRPNSLRAIETRRLAAAAAVAQSKKTSSSVASKLTESATGGRTSLGRNSTTTCSRGSLIDSANPSSITANTSVHRRTLDAAASKRHPLGTARTMQLARSLSSLSSKDVGVSNSSLSRRIGGRAESGLRSSLASQRPNYLRRSNTGLIGTNQPNIKQQVTSTVDTGISADVVGPASTTSSSIKTQPSRKLFPEPIDESDDVDMSDQPQQSINVTTTSQQQDNLASNSVISSNPAPKNSLQTTLANSPATKSVLSATSTQNGQSYPTHRRTFESIKALVLNNTGCPWRVVCSILNRMPNLEELHLSLNNYERIDLDPSEFKHHSLKRLYLCNNPKLTNWQELNKLLMAFPSLDALSIADCNISQIPDNLDRAREWRKLCGLNITGWPIKEWPVIERLNQLPSLIDLKCRNVEVLNNIDEPRHHLIARLPKLQRLNGSEIEEREHAEKAFVRFFMANSHLERPRRFHELVQKHGEILPQVGVDVDLSPPGHASVRIIFLNRDYYCKDNDDDIFMSQDFLIKLMDNVEPLSSVGNASLDDSDQATSTQTRITEEPDEDTKHVRLFKDESQEVVAVDVDLRQSVRKFKSSIADIFGLSSRDFILYYIDSEMVGLMGPELIKHNQKKLWNYNVQDGDQFIVEER